MCVANPGGLHAPAGGQGQFNGLCDLTDVAMCMAWTFLAKAGFQDSVVFLKAIQTVLRCILRVIFHCLGFTL